MGRIQKTSKRVRALHSDGVTTRGIARALGLGRSAITYHIKKMGLHHNGNGPKKLVISDGFGVCSKCEGKKSIEEFILNRVSAKSPYRLSYCRGCRSRQIRDRLNTSLVSRLRDKFTRVKKSADVVMDMKTGRGRVPESVSMDRVDPSRGYVRGNVVFCCSRINTIKQDVTPEEMRRWMPEFYRRIMSCEFVSILSPKKEAV